MPAKSSGRDGVQVIARAIGILRALEGQPGGLTPSELSGRMALARSTVHRILAALQAEDFVKVVGRGHYRLGPEIVRLASSERGELRTMVRPFLEHLSTEVSETVDLAVLIQDHITVIDHVAAPHRLRAVSDVGSTFPAHCTANGKAQLAELSDEHLVSLLPVELSQLTPNTHATRADLMNDLTQIRNTGVAFDREENTIGVSAVGAVIRDGYAAVAAVTIPMPTQRFEGREQVLVAALQKTCEEISASLRGLAGAALG